MNLQREDLPEPEKWRVDWIQGDAVAWRRDADDDTRIHDGGTAHLRVKFPDNFGVPTYTLAVNNDIKERWETPDKSELLQGIRRVLSEYTG